MRACVSVLVPLDAGLRIVAVRADLHGGPRPVLVVPAEIAYEFLLPPVAPEAKFVGLGGMNAEFRPFPGFHPLRPCIAQEAIRKQAKMVELAFLDLHPHALRAEAWLVERYLVRPWSQLGMNGSRGARPGLDRTRLVLELEQDIGKSCVALIAHIANQHGNLKRKRYFRRFQQLGLWLSHGTAFWSRRIFRAVHGRNQSSEHFSVVCSHDTFPSLLLASRPIRDYARRAVRSSLTSRTGRRARHGKPLRREMHETQAVPWDSCRAGRASGLSAAARS